MNAPIEPKETSIPAGFEEANERRLKFSGENFVRDYVAGRMICFIKANAGRWFGLQF